MSIGARHVDIHRRTDPVMYVREDRSDPGCIYVGLTPKFATATSDNKWQIHRITYDGTDLITLFANDAKYNVVWDDRATYFPACPSPSVTVPGTTDNINVSVEGLNIGGRHTMVTLPAGVWTKLPATPMPDRNAMSIQNYSGQQIKINYDFDGPLPAGYPANYIGVRIENDSERFYNVTENVEIYAMPDIAAGSVVVEVEGA